VDYTQSNPLAAVVLEVEFRTDRRQFLKDLSTMAAAAACAKPGPVGSPVSSMAWGKVSGQNQFTLVDPGRTPTGALELFPLGGLSPWETLYVVPEFGKPGPGFGCCPERHSRRLPARRPSCCGVVQVHPTADLAGLRAPLFAGSGWRKESKILSA
jgi:hypothetical protein